MGSGVCFRRRAMRTVAGEFGVESQATACFKGVRTRAVHVLLARSACKGRALSESVSTDDLSQRYGQPYARMLKEVMFASGVWYCVLLCVSQAVNALAISLAVMVGHFRARKKSILTTQTFLSFFVDRLPVAPPAGEGGGAGGPAR